MKPLTTADLKRALAQMKANEGGWNGPGLYRQCIVKSVSDGPMTTYEALKRLWNFGFRGRALDLTR